MRACLVSVRAADFDDTNADRVRGLPLLIFRAADRLATLAFGLGLVMGSSELARRHPPHHLSPARAKCLAGQQFEGRYKRPEVATATLRSNLEASQF